MAAARFIVRGKVQGVFFRGSTRDQAIALGLVGAARNLADGSVEVTAVGSGNALVALERWLWQGPPASSVSDVVREDMDASTPYRDFLTG